MRCMVNMPVLGDTNSPILIVRWLVEVGERVEVGQVILSVETDKAAVEVPSPVSGVLVELLVETDDEVEVGAPIAEIDT